MTIRFLIFLMIMAITYSGFAQFNSPNPSSPAASTAAAIEGIKMNNDLYNGKVNFSIPLLNYEFEGIDFPVSLNYVAGNGIFVDQTPGWAGLGWNLSAGGFIHRTVRGKPDETRDFETIVRKFYPGQPPPYGLALYERETTLNGTDYSYFSNIVKLQNSSTWSTQANANTLQPSQSNYPFSLPYGDYGTETFYNHHPMYDLAPDEFTFSFGSFSGKFFYDHQSHWIVESNDGHAYTVNMYTGEQYINSGQRAPKIIKYFVLTSESGIKLYFGNSDINAPFSSQYFDYSHSSSVRPVDVQEANPMPGADHVDIVPHTWHLTKVENVKTGSVVTLDYKFSGWTFYKSLQIWGNDGGIIYTNNQIFTSDPGNWNSMYRLSAISKVASRAWTLTAINFPDDVKIEFASDASTQLSTNENLGLSDNAGFYQYEDMYSTTTDNNTLLKLNRVDLKYGGQNVKGISFTYTGGQNDRLKLSGINMGKGPGAYNQQYSFAYNSTQLPAYASGKTDTWGFYNNKNFFASVTAPYDYSELSTYALYREPDNAYVQAEMLTGVTFPTGGSLTFEYEPNDYSKKINTDFSISTVSNTQGGGVRIKKLVTKAYATDAGIEKIYEYTQPGSAVSSGILASAPQTYLTGTNPGFSFNAAGFNPSFYDGSAVTYSYVKEKETANGYILYNYTNYSDAGFNNEPPVSTNTSPISSFPYAYRNNSYKRGKLKILKVFSEAGDVLKEQDYFYEHDNSEATKPELRSLFYKEQGTNAFFYSSVSERIYNDYLTKMVELENSSAGTVSTQTRTSYDQYGNVKETAVLTSDGQELVTLFKYSYEYPAGGNDAASLGIYNLNSNGIKNAVVEKLIVRQNVNGTNPFVVGGAVYQYSSPSLFVRYEYALQLSSPVALSSFAQSTIASGSFTRDTRYSQQPENEFRLYDSKGNVLEVISKNEPVRSFIYGYKKTYLVAGIVGASYSTAMALLNQSTLDAPADDAVLRNHLNSLRSIPNTFVTTYTYQPLIGLTSKTDPNGISTYYLYDEFDRLSLIRDKDGKVLSKYCYNYAGQPEDCENRFAVNALNTASMPYTLTLTNTATSAVLSYSVYPSASQQQLARVPSATYNMTLTPMYSNPPLAEFTINGNVQTGTTFTVNNLDIFNEILFKVKNTPASGPCSYTMNSGFSSPTNSISSSGTSASGYIVFSSGSTMSQGNSYNIAKINGACIPGGVRSFNTTAGGVTWTITIHADGQMYVQMAYGSSPVSSGSTVSLNISYNL